MWKHATLLHVSLSPAVTMRVNVSGISQQVCLTFSPLFSLYFLLCSITIWWLNQKVRQENVSLTYYVLKGKHSQLCVTKLNKNIKNSPASGLPQQLQRYGSAFDRYRAHEVLEPLKSPGFGLLRSREQPAVNSLKKDHICNYVKLHNITFEKVIMTFHLILMLNCL